MRKAVQSPKSKVRRPRSEIRSSKSEPQKRGLPLQNRQSRENIGKMAFIALGSNLGQSDRTLQETMNLLQGLSDEPLLRSSFWLTSPVDCPPDSPVFVNAVIGLVPRASESPESLLAKLKKLEKDFGRQPKRILNEPRPLDLDLIAFGDERRQSKELTLPHPRAHVRRFVLQPLSEIAPDLVLPGQSSTVCQLLEQLAPDKGMRRLASGIRAS